MRDRQLYWNTRVVVGKPTQATPIMTRTMKFITVNPTWNVPPSIIDNEYLPALQQDPTALERIGLKLEQNRDGTVRIYQPPGDRNALGRIRFNFPNKFLVYQHDTPDKHLFAHEKRAYSHGCMRVQDPLMYGEKLLLGSCCRTRTTRRSGCARCSAASEININFPTTIPVHHHLSDRVRGRRRQAADPRRRLRPRRPMLAIAQGLRAQGRLTWRWIVRRRPPRNRAGARRRRAPSAAVDGASSSGVSLLRPAVRRAARRANEPAHPALGDAR